MCGAWSPRALSPSQTCPHRTSQATFFMISMKSGRGSGFPRQTVVETQCRLCPGARLRMEQSAPGGAVALPQAAASSGRGAAQGREERGAPGAAPGPQRLEAAENPSSCFRG